MLTGTIAWGVLLYVVYKILDFTAMMFGWGGIGDIPWWYWILIVIFAPMGTLGLFLGFASLNEMKIFR